MKYFKIMIKYEYLYIHIHIYYALEELSWVQRSRGKVSQSQRLKGAWGYVILCTGTRLASLNCYGWSSLGRARFGWHGSEINISPLPPFGRWTKRTTATLGCFGKSLAWDQKLYPFWKSLWKMVNPLSFGGILGHLLGLYSHTWLQMVLHWWASPLMLLLLIYGQPRAGSYQMQDQISNCCYSRTSPPFSSMTGQM